MEIGRGEEGMTDDLLTVLVTAVFHDQDNLQKEAFDWGLTMASKG